ncbi:histamine H3 receptor-like [Rhinatrema bivittatum]|uniref:histamine H3 receptor-like n=1 Tax=Rhinatrema bivittatum TaxID=194408 RepID=UPI00112EEF8B|nr:histamine H3 receptor-like [Rhinatrema bivittatum]
MQSNNISRVSKAPWEGFSSTTRLIVSMFLTLADGSAVLGNSLVIFAFVIDRRLKSQSNFLLLNLAICDFIVGSFTLPICITYVLKGKWILGRGLCKLWLAINYPTCLTSVFSIVLISHDRFLSVTNAVAYRAQQGITSRAFIKMFIAWILSILIYTPAISCWDIIVGFSVIPDGECTPEFFHNRYFRFFGCGVDFFLPISVIIYFNLNIYLTINKRKKSRKIHIDKNKIKTNDEDSTADIFYVKNDGAEVYMSPHLDLRDELAASELPASLENLVDLTGRFDHRLQEHHRESWMPKKLSWVRSPPTTSPALSRVSIVAKTEEPMQLAMGG